MSEFIVECEVSTVRPIRATDVAFVRIEESSAARASVVAVWMLMATRPQIEMVLSTKTVVA